MGDKQELLTPFMKKSRLWLVAQITPYHWKTLVGM